MPRRLNWAVIFLSTTSLLTGTCTYCRAQGFVERLEPPALERGKTTRVTVFGSQLGKAVGLWTSLQAGAIKASPVGEQTASRAVLDVSVAADAPVGVCGLRLATMDGLANMVLALVEDLPVRPAPPATAALSKGEAGYAKVALPVALWGHFREAVVDRFAIDVTAGQHVGFEAVGNRFGKDVDPLLTIRDARGRIVAERDNDAGLYFDFRFEHTFVEAGTYIVEMRDARYHGSEHGLYVLRMGKFPAGRVAVPAAVQAGKRNEVRLPELASPTAHVDVPKGTAGLFFGVLKRPGDEASTWVPLDATGAEVTVHQGPGNTIEDGTPAKAPGMLCGVLAKPGERHFFRLDLAKGQRILVRAEARGLNSPADLEIAITDAKGKDIRRAGENAQEEIVLDFNVGTPGIYGLTVRDVNREGGPAYAYRVEVRTPQPQVQIVADVEGLTVPRGEYQLVPLAVTRSDYAGKITLSLLGAPPGMTVTPNEIDAGVNSVVCKLSAKADVPIGIHTLQILAHLHPPAPPLAKEGKDKAPPPVKVDPPVVMPPPTLVRTRPMIDRQIINVDLIPYGLREDQRRLPPTLTDRFALQVTPPAPFTLELPEPLVTLGRYQHVEFPVVTTRVKGFDTSITFSARGGQLAAKEEGRTRVYAELPEAKPDRPRVTGSIHSKILTNLTKHRVDVTAVGVYEGRRISLTRAFDLDVRSAFVLTAEPALLKLEPGTTAKVRITADRLKPFDGEVAVQISSAPGLNLPDKIVIPRGQTGADLELKIAPDRMPGRVSINLHGTAVVNSFEEEQRGGRFEVEVFKKPTPKTVAPKK